MTPSKETNFPNKSVKSTVYALLGLTATGGVVYADPTTYSYTGAVQTYSVPTTGTYDVLAYGGQGGTDGDGTAGGEGAKIEGIFSLTAGTQLSIVVGGKGNTGGPAFGGYGGGGGGGSWVFTSPNNLLIVAGGGGGGYISGQVGGGGLTNLGSGAAGAGSTNSGGGGGGFKGSAEGSYGGKGFSGLAGGITTWEGGANGGFGGGGASGGYGAGGGGGYTGGNGGVPGGGGTSYNGGTSQQSAADFWAGDGEVIITPQAVPEPVTSGFLVAALGAGALVVRRRMSGGCF